MSLSHPFAHLASPALVDGESIVVEVKLLCAINVTDVLNFIHNPIWISPTVEWGITVHYPNRHAEGTLVWASERGKHLDARFPRDLHVVVEMNWEIFPIGKWHVVKTVRFGYLSVNYDSAVVSECQSIHFVQ